MIKNLKLKIFGQVQGVGFRWCSYEKFAELGLTGKAENSADGAVEVEVSGEEAALEQFIEWAHQGPNGARVSKVEVFDIPATFEEESKPSE